MDDDEKASLCERILQDLDNIFRRDSNIIEFDIIEIAESKCNKSPVIHNDHHLALEKWCIPHLYEYAHEKMLNFKKQSTFTRIENSLIHQWTRILLLLNPDFTTAWNLRRNIIDMNSTNSFLEELDFTKLVLKRKPKCASVFTYREWLLNSLLKLENGHLNENLLSNELRISLDAANRYSRNYYAWSHRTWLLTVYTVHNNDHPINVLNRILNDLKLTADWLETHISDYSGFQHRQFLFTFIHRQQQQLNLMDASTANNDNNDLSTKNTECCQMFFNELQWLSTLWPIYPWQESLFLHRRHIIHATYLWYPNQIEHLKQQELQFFYDQILSNTNNMINMRKNDQIWRKQLIQRYCLYLKHNLNWSFEFDFESHFHS